jgi:hypothetical protein
MPDDAVRREPNPMLAREASFAPSTFDAEERTVEVVFTTGADVTRRDFWTGEAWIERLEVTADAVDLSRLNAGAPVLNSHQSYDLGSVIGVVERAWIAGNEGRALLRFSDRPEVRPIVEDVRSGIIRNISAGYWVERWEDAAASANGPRVRVAKRWLPGELSLVPVPADAGAQVRGVETATQDRAAARHQEVGMPDEVQPGAVTPETKLALPDSRGNDPANTAQRGGAAPSGASLAELQGIAQRGGLDSDWIVAQLTARATPEAARDAAIDAVAARRAPTQTPGTGVIGDESAVFVSRATEGLSSRLMNTAPTEAGREFRSLGLHGMIREIALRSGRRDAHRMNSDDLADFVLRAHSTSDFPNILANSANKTVRAMYGAYPNTWSSWVQEVDVPDFKTITAAFAGQFPEVQEIAEGGEVKYGTIAEEAETYAVKERARLVRLTRQAIINDDTRALEQTLRQAALAGYTALRRVVFGILTTNAAMADSVALFSTATGARLDSNLGSAGALSATTFTELRALLNKQYAPVRTGDTASRAPLPPPSQVVLLVGPDEEDTAMELLGNRIVPTVTGAVLPDGYRAQTSMVMEPFLDTGNDPYYLARTDIRAVELAYLNGRRAPEVTSAEQISHTGMDFRVLFDFGAKAVTFRTIAANLG